jgi:hypothetical protein
MSTETTKAPSLETQVAEWSATDAAIMEAVAKTDGITVAGYIDDKGAENPKKGREAVQKALTSLVTVRTGIEAKRKELKAPILALGTLVDAEAKRLTALAQPRELELQKDRDAYDAEQAKIAAEKKAEEDRLAAIAAEEARKVLQTKIDRVALLGSVPNLAQLQLITDEAFDALCSELAEAQAAKIAREAQEKADREEAERIAREQREAKEAEERRAQAEQREKDAAEAKRRRDEEDRAAAERKRLQDIEDARLEKERAELRKEREAQEAERKRLADEAERLTRAAQAERIRLVKEQSDREEAAQAERERIEAAEREAAEAARIEAEKPEREQIAAWAKAWAGAEPKHPQIASKMLRANLERTSEDILRLLNLLTGAEGGGE